MMGEVLDHRQRNGRHECSAVDTCAQGLGNWLPFTATASCAPDELAVLEQPPGWLARKLVLSNPYPILEPAGRYCGSSG